jgi:hypothetical protein
MTIDSRTIVPSCVYGIAWCLAAADHPYYALFWILIAGFIVGITFGFEGWLQNTIKAALITLAMAFVAMIPGFGELADFIVLIVIFFIKLNVIRKNFLVIVIGVVLYSVIFYWPADLHHAIAGDSDSSVYNWIDFIAGTTLMVAVSYILEQNGYSKKRIFTFTVGLPGFLFLFNYSSDSSDT